MYKDYGFKLITFFGLGVAYFTYTLDAEINRNRVGKFAEIKVWMAENKQMVWAACFLVHSVVRGAFKSNNAFEVYLGEDQIYSGIMMGRPPTLNDILRPILNF
eukprot:Trichotokara_eunicae@DN6042_c0_g1_i1.p1